MLLPYLIFTNMRFLLAIPNRNSGGGERSYIRLAEDLTALGHDVVLLLCEPYNAHLNEYPLMDIPENVKCVSLNKKRVLFSILPFGRFTASFKPDIVFATIPHMNEMAILSKLIFWQKHPVCIRENSITTGTFTGIFGKFKLWLRNFLYSRASMIWCVSDNVRKDLTSQGVENPNMRVLYTPVLNDTFLRRSAEPLPPEFAYLASEPYFVTAARLEPIKNQAYMIRAFARIADKIPHKLVIVGDGNLRAELENLAKSLNVSDRVVFAGFHENARPFIAHASLFLLTSNFEAGSRALIEAICLGVNCAVTDPSGCEYLDYGKIGRVITKHDESLYAQAILDELKSPSADSETLKEYGRRNFSASDNIKKLSGFVERLVNRK